MTDPDSGRKGERHPDGKPRPMCGGLGEPSQGRYRVRPDGTLQERFMAKASPTDEQLKLFFERIERLEEERKGIGDDIRDTFSEAKSQGYDTKIMRQVLRLRKMQASDRQEMETLIETYKAAIGME